MKKLLFSMQPTNDLGLLAQSLPIAHELRDRGHKVIFCSPAKAPSKVISHNGFKNFSPGWPIYMILNGDTRFKSFLKMFGSMHLKRDLGILSWYINHMKENATSEIWNIDHFTYIMGMCNEQYVKAVIETLTKMIVKHKPDAIVNFWNPFMCIVARINKVPLISVIQADLHPQSKGFIWWKEPPSSLPTPAPLINKILSEYQMPAIKSMGDLSLGDLTLVLGIREMEPIPDCADITYIGPMLLQNLNEKLPEWMNNLRKDQPIIWVYPGNMRYIKGHDSPFDGIVILQTCIEALRDSPIQVIVSTGHQTLTENEFNLPSNFRLTTFVPGLAMAERSDLIIHHGGYGSCQTGLYAGTPSLIIPTYSERESNARRIASIGAGDFILPITDVSGKQKSLDAKELRSKIEHLLSEPSYKENAMKISNSMKKYAGASGTANLIEKYIQG